MVSPQSNFILPFIVSRPLPDRIESSVLRYYRPLEDKSNGMIPAVASHRGNRWRGTFRPLTFSLHHTHLATCRRESPGPVPATGCASHQFFPRKAWAKWQSMSDCPSPAPSFSGSPVLHRHARSAVGGDRVAGSTLWRNCSDGTTGSGHSDLFFTAHRSHEKPRGDRSIRVLEYLLSWNPR